MRVPSLSLFLIAGLVAFPSIAQTQAEIAAEARIYGVLPLASHVRLSPDGKSLAVVAGLKGRQAFAIWHLDGGQPTVLGTGQTEPAGIVWKTNDRLLASVYYGDFKHFMSAASVTRTLVLDADGSNHRVIDFKEMQGLWGQPDQFQDQIVSLLPNDPDRVLVYGRSLHSNLATIDIKSGIAAPFALDLDAYGWMADRDGALRFAEKPIYEGRRFYYRSDAGGKWSEVPNLLYTDKEPIWQLAFSAADKSIVYMTFYHEDKTAEIRAVDLRDGAVKEVVAAKPGEAAHAILYKGELIGYTFGDDVPIYLDEQVKKSDAIVRKALPGHRVGFVDRDDDRQHYLFQADAAGEGESFWLLDLKPTPAQLRPLFQAYDDLPPEKVATVKKIAYVARDGLTIPGILTLPHGYRSGPIPFIVMPHGGPAQHDSLAFDYMTQFFAALGYGVLQPQYRGSTGHGLALFKAGYGQWGRKMQDDIADGTRWLVEQGYADKARMAIVGFSYGGYAALMGGIRDPDLYACVVAGAPVADFAQFVTDMGHHPGHKTSIPEVRDPDVPLAQISPVKRAKEIKAPVLLVHGRLDFTVPVEHSEAMEQELKFYDRPVKAVYFDQADHYFGREADRVAMLQTVGEFLAAHLSAANTTGETSR